MMSERICTTQADVDAATQAGDLIIIDATWRGNASTVLWGNARAVLRDNARADLRGNASAVLWDNARADLWDNASASLWDNASADLRGNASADLWDNARAVLRDNARADLRDNARADLRGWLASARLIGPDATASGQGRWMRVQSPEDWCRYHGLVVEDGHVWLTKSVDADGRSERGALYLPGQPSPKPDRWDPSPDVQCGAGLHLSPSATHARSYYNPDGGRVMECRVALTDIAVYEPDLSKVRVRAITEIREVTP